MGLRFIRRTQREIGALHGNHLGPMRGLRPFPSWARLQQIPAESCRTRLCESASLTRCPSNDESIPNTPGAKSGLLGSHLTTTILGPEREDAKAPANSAIVSQCDASEYPTALAVLAQSKV